MKKQKINIFLYVILLGIGLISVTKQSIAEHAATGVVSVDIKYINNTVHLLLGKIEQDKHSLLYQASYDQGQTWTSLVNITTGLDITAKLRRGNDARLAVQGDNIVVVWMSRANGTPHNAGSMMSVRSNDAGKTWQQATMPADWDGPHGFFAMDGNEKQINLVWLDSREQAGKGSQGMRYTSSLDGGVTWLKNQTLDQQTCACCWNTARFNDDGEFYVLYRDKHPSDMAIGKVNQQHQWQRLSTVGDFDWDFQGCPHIGGSLAFDEKNYFHATVGTGHEQYAGLYYLNSLDQGKTWSDPIQLGDDSAVHSDLAVNGEGYITASWDKITATGYQIVYAQSIDQGQTWSEAKVLSVADKSSSHPRVVAMKDNALVVWTESDADSQHILKMTTVSNGNHP